MIKQKNEKKSNAEMLQRFRDYQEKRGRSENTQVIYARAVNKLFTHSEKAYDKIDTDDIDNFEQFLRKGGKGQDPLAPKTRGVYIAGVKAFYRWLTRKDILDRDKMISNIEPVQKQYAKPYPYLTKEEGERILREIETRTRPREWTTRIIVRLGMIGLRDGEVLGLKMKDVDFDRGTIIIQSIPSDPHRGAKGNKPRTLLPNRYKDAFGFDIFQELTEYLETHESKKGDDYLVRNLQGKPIAPHTNYSRLHRVTNRAIGRKVKFHALRHWCATAMRDAKVDLDEIMGHLGHESEAQTLKYIHTPLWREAEARRKGTHSDLPSPEKTGTTPRGEFINGGLANGDYIAQLVDDMISGRISEEEFTKRCKLYGQGRKLAGL